MDHKAAASRRLMRDWKEIMANPLPTVVAAPLEHDLFKYVLQMSSLWFSHTYL